MHLLGLGLHVVLAICCAIHAVRSGQERYWLFILFMFPLLGSIVYLIAIMLPQFQNSRGARRAVRHVRTALDPGRELREAQQAFADSASVDNILRLADAQLAAGQPEQALPLYRSALTGLYAQDPDIEVRLARAELEAGRPSDARLRLEGLIARRPDFRSPEGHLTYARALAALGERAAARHEFEVLVGYASGLRARASFAEQLWSWGEHDAALQLRDESLELARRLPRNTQALEQRWIAGLERMGR